MNQKITLKEFLKISKDVTENYIRSRNGKKWNLSEQWSKINEEDDEFRHAEENSLNQLEEFWDCFFSKLTLLHLQGIDDYAIMESANSTWNKIYQRSCKTLSNSEQQIASEVSKT